MSSKYIYRWPQEKRRIFWVWAAMVKRCNNPKTHQFADYGGRGITVAPEWRSFDQFLADMGMRPTPKHTLDRIDNDKGYQPGNCVWSTRGVQAKNKRRYTRNDESLPSGVWRVGDRYRAGIRVDRKPIHLGYFGSPGEAVIAVAKARVDHGFSPTHGV